MPRGTIEVASPTENPNFRFRDYLGQLLAVKLIELNEVPNKFNGNEPKPAVFLRVAKIEDDGTATTLARKTLDTSQVLVDVFSRVDPDLWYTGRVIKPNAAYLWEPNKSEEEELCDKAVESLDVTDQAAKKILEEF